MRKLTTNYTFLEILVRYINNLSEETLFGRNKIKEQHETMKLQNEEVMLAQLKTLKTMIINELNRFRSQCIKMRNFSEKNYLY